MGIIDNYQYLLRAIMLQDNYKSNSVICIYDLYNNEKLFTTFSTTKLCADYFKTSCASINTAICRQSIFQKRFILKRVKIN